MDCSYPMHRACLTSICSWRERWTGAYDALVNAATAAAAAVRKPGCTVALADLHCCVDASATAGLGPAASRHDELFCAVHVVDKDLRDAAAGWEENEMEEEKNRPPTTPLTAEDK